MKRVQAAATAAFFWSTVVVADGRVQLGVESAEAAAYRAVERPDLIIALAMSLYRNKKRWM